MDHSGDIVTSTIGVIPMDIVPNFVFDLLVEVIQITYLHLNGLFPSYITVDDSYSSQVARGSGHVTRGQPTEISLLVAAKKVK